MASKKAKWVSAQVLLRSASGKAVGGDTVISADNIAEYAPSPGAVSAAQQAFQAAGFEVGPMVGISFSIAAPIRTFEQFFRVKIKQQKDGSLEVLQNGVSYGLELPLNAVPRTLSGLIAAVTFEPPAELLRPRGLLDV
jgi:hypothetical protein